MHEVHQKAQQQSSHEPQVDGSMLSHTPHAAARTRTSASEHRARQNIERVRRGARFDARAPSLLGLAKLTPHLDENEHDDNQVYEAGDVADWAEHPCDV